MDDFKLTDKLGHRLTLYTDGISMYAEINAPTLGSLIFTFPSDIEVSGINDYLYDWIQHHQPDFTKMPQTEYTEYMNRKREIDLETLNPRNCPLCGSEPIFDRESLTVCCPNCHIATNVDNWEDRDVEDEQKAEISRLRRTIDCLTEKVEYLQDIIDSIPSVSQSQH